MMNEIILNKKTLNGLGSRINDNAKGSEISSFAKKQMEKMGWKEGQGLGKTESGMVTHIKAKKLLDSEGIGAKEARIENDNSDTTWWHDGFANALQNMKKKRKRSKKDKEVYTATAINYDELFKATGGARLGMRARGEQNGKFKRSESLNSEIIGKNNEIVGNDIVNNDVITVVDTTETESKWKSEFETECESEPNTKKTKKSDKKKEKKVKKEKKHQKSKE